MTRRRKLGLLSNVLTSNNLRSQTKIYGVAWDKSTSPTLTRTDDAVGMVANAGVGMTSVVNDFDTAEIFGEISEVTDALGNVFVRIPKFYIKKTDGVGIKTWQVSKRKWSEEWYLPWCFWNFSTGQELPYIDVGKYNASLSPDNKLESKPNTYPLANKNIVQFRDYARANGDSYQQLDIHVVDVLQALFYVEFATLNSQAVMNGFVSGQYTTTHLATVAENGVNRIVVANAHAALYAVGQAISVSNSQDGNQVFYGRTITAIDIYDDNNKAIWFDGAPVNIPLGAMFYNTGWKSGFSSGVAAKSGSLTSNSDGKNPMVYRGIENLWGSVWQFVDGLNINEFRAWVCPDQAQYASNLFAAPYEQVGYLNHNANGYVVESGWDQSHPYAALPTSVAGGETTTYYSDYYYQNTGQRIALVGGYWRSGSYAGLACWALNYAAADAFMHLSGRLLKKPL
jgi:hypothetical protein